MNEVTRWLHVSAVMYRDIANGTRIMRDDTNRDRLFTDEEQATFKQWIENAERMESEANAILKNWTALPGEEG